MIQAQEAKINGIEDKIKAADEAVFAKAQTSLLAQKEKAAQVWRNSGGDSESFKAAWPEMEKKILSQKVLAVLGE